MAKAVLDELGREPGGRFTVGIVDDVTFSSSPTIRVQGPTSTAGRVLRARQ